MISPELIEVQHITITLNFVYFLTRLKELAIPEKVGE